MSAFSFFACSFSTVLLTLSFELALLFIAVQFESVRNFLLQKIKTYRNVLFAILFFHLVPITYLFCVSTFLYDQEIKRVTAEVRLFSGGIPRYDGEIPEGIIEFEEIQNDDGTFTVFIQGRITNIEPSDALHGFHIHEVANYSKGCDSTGGHYNPTKQDHGDISHSARHVGDLGNVYADYYGLVNVNLQDSMIRLTGNNVFNITGKPLVIHAQKDDLGLGNSPASKLNGNAGKRLLCGTVVRS